MHEENRRKEAMRSRQLAERLGVEEAHMLEYQQFNMDWDRKMGEFENHANDLVDAMRQRHQVSELTHCLVRNLFDNHGDYIRS